MDIVGKIKALFAKAASTDNEHEAMAFLAKAHELMEKHQLEAGDLDRDDPVDGEAYYTKGSVKAAPDWDMMLIFSVARYFGCKGCRCSKDGKWYMDLVGRESARVTAKEMHAYLVKTVRRLGREAVGTHEFQLLRKDRHGNTYWDGEYMNADQCARRIGNALRIRISMLAAENEAKEQASVGTPTGRNALVTLDQVMALYKARHPDAESIGGTFYTTAGAERVAAGIGLNLQTTGGSAGRLLK